MDCKNCIYVVFDGTPQDERLPIVRCELFDKEVKFWVSGCDQGESECK